jgi:hypothetical protein
MGGKLRPITIIHNEDGGLLLHRWHSQLALITLILVWFGLNYHIIIILEGLIVEFFSILYIGGASIFLLVNLQVLWLMTLFFILKMDQCSLLCQ